MRLRRWLLAGAVVLVAVLAGLVGYARHRARAALLNLPHLLGADIKSETDGYTYSQTIKGRTLFTIHAAKAIQHRNGRTTLQNVAVTLYGEPGTNRVDRIRGAEFEYDQPTGIVRAMGESEIDLASPAETTADKPDAKRIHVTASGLVFNQKLGTATTEEPIQFGYGAVHGSARGADFDAHTGMLELHHDVHVVYADNGQNQQMDADTATIDRQQRTATMTRAIVAQTGQSMRAQGMLVRLRSAGGVSSGSIESIHGTGGVELRTADGAVADAPTLEVNVSPQNRLREAILTGGVTMRGVGGKGQSGTATVLFDERGRASHVRLAQAVDLRQRGGGTRQLLGDSVEGMLATDAAGHTVLQEGVATGHASLHLIDVAVGQKPAKETTLAGEMLHAFAGQANGRWQVRRIVGDGATRVEEHELGGDDRISTANHVEMLVTPAGDLSAAGAIESFVQQGHVHAVEHRPAAGAKPASESVADADRAEYLAGAGTVLLTGSSVLRNELMEIAAKHITITTKTGDAEAVDMVKGSYRAHAGAMTGAPDREGMLHFLADRALTHRSAQQATLFGGVRPVRLWNGTSQIEAPVVDVDQAGGTLFAHDAEHSHMTAPVHAVLPAGNGARTTGKDDRLGGIVRILSHALRYHQAEGATPAAADFTGAVRLDTATGQVQCDHATALLRGGTKSSEDTGLLGGAVDTVTADGRVRVMQPGRLASGSHLVYTAATQQFLLTGSPVALPTVRDSIQGTVTGTALLFHAGDDSVEVSGAPGQPVRTEIDAPPRKGTQRGMPKAAESGSGTSKTAQKK